MINKTAKHVKIAKFLALILDNRFEVLGIRFGLDPILDLVPGVGDIIGVVLGLYIVYVAVELKLPQDRINRMFLNIIIDFIIGLIPLAGIIGTIFYRSNQMNIKIIEEYLQGGVVEEGEIVG
jgi:hypothetical protein